MSTDVGSAGNETAGLKPVRAEFLHDESGEAAVIEYSLATAPIRQVVRKERLAVAASMVLIMFPLACFLCYQAVEHSVDLTMESGTVMLAGILGALFTILYYMYARTHGTWSKFARESDALLFQKLSTRTMGTPDAHRVVLAADTTGISYRGDDSGTMYGWKHFEEAVELDGFIGLPFAGSSTGIAVPHAAFKSEDERAAFVRDLRALLGASGYGLPERIRSFAADGKARCWKCRYNLNGLHADRCPECGTKLTSLGVTVQRELDRRWWKRRARPPA